MGLKGLRIFDCFSRIPCAYRFLCFSLLASLFLGFWRRAIHQAIYNYLPVFERTLNVRISIVSYIPRKQTYRCALWQRLFRKPFLLIEATCVAHTANGPHIHVGL